MHFKVIVDLESGNNSFKASADTLTSEVAIMCRLSNGEDWDYFKLVVNSTEDLKLRVESLNSINLRTNGKSLSKNLAILHKLSGDSQFFS